MPKRKFKFYNKKPFDYFWAEQFKKPDEAYIIV